MLTRHASETAVEWRDQNGALVAVATRGKDRWHLRFTPGLNTGLIGWKSLDAASHYVNAMHAETAERV